MSASTQNHVLAAFLFFYRDLLEGDLELEGVVRTRSRRLLAVVLTPEEMRAVLGRLEGVDIMVTGLLYGSGLRLMETLRLRVQYLDVNRRVLTVHNGKAERSAARWCLNAYSGRCSAIWRTCAESTTRIWQQVGSGSFYPMPP